MKPLQQVSTADVAALARALRSALDGTGPAVWPVPDSLSHHTTHARVRGFATSASSRDDAFVANERTRAWDAGTGAGREVPDGVAVVVETSGSTDAPKRVLLSAAALRASADATADVLDGHGRWVLALPAHYIAGVQVLVRSIVAGTEPIVLAEGSFDAHGFAAASARLVEGWEGRRFTSLVPVQLARLVDAAEAEAQADGAVTRALRRFDAILVGGQRLEPALAKRAERLAARIIRTYGSSETAGGCVYDGVPLPGVEARIVDGEIELGGPTLADGYLDDPERSAAVFEIDADGTRWWRTGDLGTVTSDGRMRVTGRADDIIISGGVKVVLGEVERVVRTVAGFEHAAVVAMPDPEWGDRPAVVLDRLSAEPSGETSALGVLREATDTAGLPPAARPARIVTVERMPLLASGKPDRRALAALVR